MKTSLQKIFKKIKLLALDVDGVLTKGEIIYDNEGRELKIFDVKDGLGIFLLNKLGIKVILLSAKNSPILKKRAKDFGAEVLSGILPKEKVLEIIKKRYGIKKEEICFLGDDIIDIGILKEVGLGIAVKDAVSEVKKIAKFITSKRGGEGAVREVVELFFKARGIKDKYQFYLDNL